jgi:hypothetical protein
MTSRTYRIVIEGELGSSVADAFDPLVMVHVRGTSVLTGRVRDQAELQAIVQRIGSLGLTLLSAAEVGKDEPSA